MSTLYVEQCIDVVRLTLKLKNNAGTTTYHLGRRFYPPNAIYSGSPVVYPLLVDSPRRVRSVGREVAILHTVTINIYGKNYFTKVGESFVDLIDAYDLVSSSVQCRTYFRSRDGTTTHADGTNIRQTLEITDFSWSGDILTLNCKDTWFKNKEISKRFTDETFTALDEHWYGEYGGIVFGGGEGGTGVVIDAPIFDYGFYNNGRPFCRIFTGWAATSHPLNWLYNIYVRNLWKDFNKSEWTLIHRQSDPQAIYIGSNDTTATTTFSLAEHARGYAHAEPGAARLLTHVQVLLSPHGTVTAADGQLRLEISYAQYQPSNDSFQPVGPVLATISLDPAGLITSDPANGWFQLPTYLLIHPATNYFILVDWSNYDDTANYIKVYLRGNVGGKVHFARSNTEKVSGWTRQTNVEWKFALYAAGDGDDAWVDLRSSSVAPYRYSYYHFEARAANVTVDEARLGWDRSLEFKVAVKGLEDDDSGTYTGSPTALITNPADIIRFLLLEDEIGLGLSPTAIDTTYFDNARTDLGSKYNMSFSIDTRTDLQDLIPHICRQARIIFYKQRAGKLAVKYPRPIGPTYTAVFEEARMKHDLVIVEVSDTQNDTVINDILIPFGIDPLNTPKDPALLRRVGTNAYKAAEYITGTTASFSDSGRLAKAAESQAIYGRKEYRHNFDFYPADSTAPQTVLKYLLDRWHTKQKRCTFRVPLVKYYAQDFFDSCYVAHCDLAGQGSTSEQTLINYDGTATTCYYYGCPVGVSKQGNIAGEVVALEEFEDDIIITIETTNNYQA